MTLAHQQLAEIQNRIRLLGQHGGERKQETVDFFGKVQHAAEGSSIETGSQ
jgi:hypothetical protein